MWHLGTRFRGDQDVAGLVVGLNDFEGLPAVIVL